MSVLDENIIQSLSEYIQSTIGLYFPPEKYNELKYKITELSKENGYSNFSSFAKSIIERKKDVQFLELLSAKLTIGETYFWRDRELFRLLETKILPELINKKQKSNKTIRIWSAGCSSGEEPYSIAILFNRLIPKINEWNIIINATDINPNAIKKAIKGNYTEWSFRSAPSWLKDEYFIKKDKNVYHLDESVRRMVNFSYLNFFEDVYPSLSNDTNAIDIIFCRNVLMYFSQEDIKNISDKFYDCLVINGFLITSPSESFQFLSTRFKYVYYKNVTLYQRRDDEAEKKKIQIPKTELTQHKPRPEIRKTYIRYASRRRTNPEKKRVKTRSIKTEPLEYTYSDAVKAYHEGNSDKALKIIQNLSDKNENPEIQLLETRINANDGNLKIALSKCENIINNHKLYTEAYYLKAIIEIELGKTDLAYESLQKSLYLNPDFIISHFTLGNLMYNREEIVEANKHFKNSIQLLNKLGHDEIVPETDGLTAGRLKDMIMTYLTN